MGLASGWLRMTQAPRGGDGSITAASLFPGNGPPGVARQGLMENQCFDPPSHLCAQIPQACSADFKEKES